MNDITGDGAAAKSPDRMTGPSLFSQDPRSLSNLELESVVISSMYSLPKRRAEIVACLVLGIILMIALKDHLLIVGPIAGFCFYTAAQRWSEIKSQEFLNEFFLRIVQQDIDPARLGDFITDHHGARFSMSFDKAVAGLIAFALLVMIWFLWYV